MTEAFNNKHEKNITPEQEQQQHYVTQLKMAEFIIKNRDTRKHTDLEEDLKIIQSVSAGFFDMAKDQTSSSENIPYSELIEIARSLYDHDDINYDEFDGVAISSTINTIPYLKALVAEKPGKADKEAFIRNNMNLKRMMRLFPNTGETMFKSFLIYTMNHLRENTDIDLRNLTDRQVNMSELINRDIEESIVGMRSEIAFEGTVGLLEDFTPINLSAIGRYSPSEIDQIEVDNDRKGIDLLISDEKHSQILPIDIKSTLNTLERAIDKLNKTNHFKTEQIYKNRKFTVFAVQNIDNPDEINYVINSGLSEREAADIDLADAKRLDNMDDLNAALQAISEYNFSHLEKTEAA